MPPDPDPLSASKKESAPDSAGAETPATFPRLPDSTWTGMGGPLRVAARLAWRSPGSFAALLGLDLAGTVASLFVLVWLAGHSRPGLPLPVLALALLVSVPARLTCLVATRSLLDGEPGIDLLGATRQWLRRLPELALLFAGLGLLSLTAIGLGTVPAAWHGKSPGLEILVALLVVDRLVAIALLSVPALVLEGMAPRDAVATAWDRAGPPGWALWTAGSACLVLLLAAALAPTPFVGMAWSRLGSLRFPELLFAAPALLGAAVAHALLAMSWATVDETRRGPDRPRPGTLGVAVRAGLAFAFFGAFVATMQTNREYANRRACFANQKTIAGALEMYALDMNVPVPAYGAAIRKELTRNGYLCHVPQDPGQGAESEDHYVVVPTSVTDNGILCLYHGTWPRPGIGNRAARVALEQGGVTDPELLARANPEVPTGRSWWQRARLGSLEGKLRMLLLAGLPPAGAVAFLSRIP